MCKAPCRTNAQCQGCTIHISRILWEIYQPNMSLPVWIFYLFIFQKKATIFNILYVPQGFREVGKVYISNTTQQILIELWNINSSSSFTLYLFLSSGVHKLQVMSFLKIKDVNLSVLFVVSAVRNRFCLSVSAEKKLSDASLLSTLSCRCCLQRSINVAPLLPTIQEKTFRWAQTPRHQSNSSC